MKLQICYYDPQSGKINVQSSQSTTTPRKLIINLSHKLQYLTAHSYNKKINDTWKGSDIKVVCIISGPDKFLQFILTVLSRHTCTGQQQQKAGQSTPLQVAGESVNTTLLTCPQNFFSWRLLWKNDLNSLIRQPRFSLLLKSEPEQVKMLDEATKHIREAIMLGRTDIIKKLLEEVWCSLSEAKGKNKVLSK